jgi:large subunit ribosomal protein L17
MRNLASALIEHERITTTVAKAKELRPFVERLVTLAKRGLANPETGLHARRLIVARLGNKEMMRKLFTTIAPRFTDRPGGYTRIIKRSYVRLGDAGPTAFIEFLKEGETKAKKERAPAPRVAEPEAPPPEAPAGTPPAGVEPGPSPA